MTWQFYTLFNSIIVISGQWEGGNEGLCAVKHLLGSDTVTPKAYNPVRGALSIRPCGPFSNVRIIIMSLYVFFRWWGNWIPRKTCSSHSLR